MRLLDKVASAEGTAKGRPRSAMVPSGPPLSALGRVAASSRRRMP